MLEVPSLCTGLADCLINYTMLEVASLCTALADRLISYTMLEVPSLCTGLADCLINYTMLEVASLCTALADCLVNGTMLEVPSCTRMSYHYYAGGLGTVIVYRLKVASLCTNLRYDHSSNIQALCTISMDRLDVLSVCMLDVTVLSGWLSVWMFLCDLGANDMYKQHDTALMEMRACLFISSRDQVTMHRSQQ